jgi:hypothetical protein
MFISLLEKENKISLEKDILLHFHNFVKKVEGFIWDHKSGSGTFGSGYNMRH